MFSGILNRKAGWLTRHTIRLLRTSLLVSAISLGACKGDNQQKNAATSQPNIATSVNNIAKSTGQEKPVSTNNQCHCPQIVPFPSGVYHGAFVGDFIDEESVKQFEKMAEAKLNIGLKFIAFSTPLHFPAEEATVMAQRNGAIFIKLEPWSARGNKDQSFSLTEIIAGTFDPLLFKFAKAANTFGKPAFVAFGHEMNGNWYPWGGNSELYKQAYRHVHEVVSKEACNLTWVWNPNLIEVNEFSNYYPGDNYVDWVAIDGYNSVDWGAPWRTYEQIFSPSLEIIRKFNKPIMIAEFASDANDPTDKTFRKPQFISQAISSITTSSDPPIKGFIYFNVSKEEKGLKDWALNTPQSQEAYRSALKAQRSHLVEGLKTTCR